jgi:CheY-like chemotaxis protein
MKVVLMTAFEINKEEAQMVLPSTPIDAFVSKPFRTADLIQAIRECAKS